MDQLAYTMLARGLSFLAVFLLVLGVKFFFSAKKQDTPWANAPLPFTFKGFFGEIKVLKDTFGSEMKELFRSKSDAIADDIKRAALPLDPGDVFACQLLWAILLAVCGISVALLIEVDFGYVLAGLFIFAFIGWLIPVVQVQNLAEARQNAVRRALPFAIDLISSAMAAGLDFSAAVRYYVERSVPSPLTQEFGITLKMLELGSNRNDALKEMAARLGIDEFRSLVNAVIQGTEMGASITDTLRINAEEIRRVRVAAAERKAQRAPSLMMIPMALFIMPSVFIIIFVPIYLRVQSSGMAGMF